MVAENILDIEYMQNFFTQAACGNALMRYYQFVYERWDTGCETLAVSTSYNYIFWAASRPQHENLISAFYSCEDKILWRSTNWV